MSLLNDKFLKLGIDNAPGQEKEDQDSSLPLKGDVLSGRKVDFSHGDVNAFLPTPGSLEIFIDGFNKGGSQAYTEYRGACDARDDLAKKISNLTNTVVSATKNIIITPGTQGALFLAMGSLIAAGDKVAIMEPDYFANRKLVEFFDGIIVPIELDYANRQDRAGINLMQLEAAFKTGTKLFVFSNPNNPTGVIYTKAEIQSIAELAGKYGATVLVDELYSRQIFDGRDYFHLCNESAIPAENLVTIMGPSKTESLSGFRLGIAFGSAAVINRMEKLQAIVSLRAAGYSQAVLHTWFNEPKGWMEERIMQHQQIRDDILAVIQSFAGVQARPTEGGSYLFVEMPQLEVHILDFVKIVRVLTNVTITPGTEFGPQFTQHFRINFSQDHAAAVDAIKRVMYIIERYRK